MITISKDETHHIRDGKPLYDFRYTRVMSFHNRIAPVFDGRRAFFIDMENRRLFNRTFFKAYGFYEGTAAVRLADGWFHISERGMDLYPERYDWVGNFQEEKCAVRDLSGNYFHISKKGCRIYPENYAYVGDYKYGIAVATSSNYRAFHIDNQGTRIYKHSYRELDVYHKGFAVALDTDGYVHIDKNGEPVYEHRFIKLEPFYNGQALATTKDFRKVLVSEIGEIRELEINKDIPKC